VPRLQEATMQARRHDLVVAARRAVGRRGFQSLTVDDVCAEAGVSKGAFYVYFDQKKDLLLALIDDEGAEVEQLMDRLERHSRGAERLRRFARQIAQRGDEPELVQIRADIWAEMSSDAIVRERWAGVMSDRRARLSDWIEEAVSSGDLGPIPANALAAILLALSDGLLLHAGLDPRAFRWNNIVKAVDAILEGLSNRG
jgi:AcrR family transcriptional regulator